MSSDEERLPAQLSQRASQRSSVTKFVKKCEQLSGESEITPLEVALQQLENAAQKLDKINSEVAENSSYSPLETDFNQILSYEESAEEQIFRLRSLVARHSSANAPASVRSSPSSSATTEPSPVLPVITSKRPELKIPFFDGQIANWIPFWEQFDAVINSCLSIPAIEKFNHLRAQLRGPALSAIDGLQCSEANYKSAIQILQRRFGREEQLIQYHLDRLLHIEQVRDSRDTPALRKLYDAINANIRTLEALGESLDNFSALLFPILKSALPAPFLMDFMRQEDNREHSSSASTVSVNSTSSATKRSGTLNRLLEFLRREVEYRETMGIKPSRSTPASFGNDQRRHQTNSSSEKATTKPNNAQPRGSLDNMHASTRSCFLCAANHATADCNANLTLQAKKEKLKTERRCFRCTGDGHQSRQCSKKIECKKCQGRHATTLCDPQFAASLQQRNANAPNQGSTASAPNNNRGPSAAGVNASHASSEDETTNGPAHYILPTATVWAEGDQLREQTRCLFDGGSELTFIRTELADKLNLKIIGDEVITVNPFGGTSKSSTYRVQRVELWLRSQHDRSSRRIVALAVDTEQLCAKEHRLPNEAVSQLHNSIPGAKLADAVPTIDPMPIDIVIGNDNYWKLVSTNNVQLISNAMVATNSVFGWLISGALSNCASSSTVSLHAGVYSISVEKNHEDNELLRRFWELEHIGILPNQNTPADNLVDSFNEQILFDGSRYTTSLLWRERENLANNQHVALNRLSRLTRKLQQDTSALERYDAAIRDYVYRGFAEKVPLWSASSTTYKPVYYMPHRGVLRAENSSTPLRVVFDASSHGPSVASLNEHLHAGPNLNPELVQVLLRFRCFKVALAADIEKAFHQIQVRNEDRDALRFLWYDVTPFPNSDYNVEEWRMTRVPFGITCSPFILSATLRFHLDRCSDEHSKTSQLLSQQLYVDDLLFGGDSSEQATRMRDEATAMMETAGMILRKWRSNFQPLNDDHDVSSGTSTVVAFCRDSEQEEKILGLGWNAANDVFVFDGSFAPPLSTDNRPTKRDVLRFSARLFDPLGLLQPFSIRARILFQRTWQAGLDWDSPLPEDLEKSWRDWVQQVPQLATFSTPRFIDTASDSVSCQLHIFTDASQDAYGASVYLVTSNSDGSSNSHLVLAKARVAPLQRLTIPRLELTAALLGARLANYVTDCVTVKLRQTFFWTDSQITLHWIRGDSHLRKPFVANRVSEIQSLSDPAQWRFCPGTQNPADLLTRGLSVSQLAGSKLWFNGPTFIREDVQAWPDQPASTETPPQDEDRPTSAAIATQMTTAVTTNNFASTYVSKFSDLQRLLRVTSYLLRPALKHKPSSVCLSAAEIRESEVVIIRQIQRESFAVELSCIAANSTIPKSSKLHDLSPFVGQDDLLRVGGRLHNMRSSTTMDAHPIILPGDHHLTQLIVASAHRRILHGGIRDTLVELRERFFVISARQVIRSFISRCKTCKRFKQAAATAPSASLPVDRVIESSAFEVVGMDFAGPIELKNQPKSYILLITCANTRAVHLELVNDLSARSFLLAFRRFVARRGLCRVIYSDNALCFKRANADLKILWNTIRDNSVQAYYGEHRIDWKFIPERSPFWGGFYERLVGVTKNCLRRTLGRALVTYEEMITVLCEVEAVVNSRPLTYSYNDTNEPYPLCPSHFLIGRRLTSLPPSAGDGISGASSTELNRRWMRRQYLMNQFWRRWSIEYLGELRSAHHVKPGQKNTLQEGDLVLVHEDHRPRLLWKMARINKLFPGRDGCVRSCELRLPNGTVTRRAVQLLYPLEC